eukprot:4533045-Amphidinium_carterae.1
MQTAQKVWEWIATFTERVQRFSLSCVVLGVLGVWDGDRAISVALALSELQEDLRPSSQRWLHAVCVLAAPVRPARPRRKHI